MNEPEKTRGHFFLRRYEYLIFCLFFLLFMTIAICINLHAPVSDESIFGYEYGNIAEAIVLGAGYANPFGSESGPTSWMPPLYPLLLAAIFYWFGIKTHCALYALLTIKYAALSTIPILLWRIIRNNCSGQRPLLVFPIFVFLIFSSFGSFFKINDDVWLYTLFISLLFYLYQHHALNSKPNKMGVGWGILGGIILLTNPVLGAVFVLLTFMPIGNITLKRKGLLLLLSTLICFPWVIRNYIVFDRFIFVKSNFFYEMYQNNISDEDGLLDGKNLSQGHPYFNEKARQEYITMGEVAFIDKYRHAFLAYLTKNPINYFKKCLTRVLYIFLLYPEYSPRSEIATLSANLSYYLKAGFYWIPFAISIFLILNPATRSRQTIQICIIIYFVYLVPYILVGYYNRYRIPLLPVFVVLYFHFLSSLIELYRSKQGSSARNYKEDEWLP